MDKPVRRGTGSVDDICCPICHQSLKPLVSDAAVGNCAACGVPYVYREGVIDFMPDDDFYWGEISRDKMKLINEQAVDDGWFSVIRQHQPELISHIVDPTQIGWLFHCYDEQANQACLDVGSGWGALGFILSRFYKTVYSVDSVYERLRFQAIRAELDNVDNIRILRCPLLQLPLPDDAVNLVVLNGVLEWIGLSDLQRKPNELQMTFLSEIRRVLKPTGILYLGVENQFSALNFLGAKDHSRLPLTSLVPRWLANIMSRVTHRRKENRTGGTSVFSDEESDCRTYTYSIWGYEKMLRQAGFPKISSYWAWHSYSYPKMSGILDGNSIRHYTD